MPASIDAREPEGLRTGVRLKAPAPDEATEGFTCAELTLRPVQLAMSAMPKLAPKTCMRPGSVAALCIQVLVRRTTDVYSDSEAQRHKQPRKDLCMSDHQELIIDSQSRAASGAVRLTDCRAG